MRKKAPEKPVIRRRPKLSATVAAETLTALNVVARETGLPNVGVAIDYVVKDWNRLKRQALPEAEPEPA
jgi:hypothetical protein